MGEALDLVNKFYKAFGSGDIDGADDVFSDDCIFETPAGPLKKPEHRMMIESFRGGFPDSRMEIEHALEGNGEVYLEGKFRGTHTGDLVSAQGTVPATGKKIDVRYAEYFEIRDGKVTAQRTYWDQGEMMGQLGLAP